MPESLITSPASPVSGNEVEQLATICENRASTYGFLARLFKEEVDQALLDSMRGMCFPASGGQLMVQGYRLIATYLSNVWANSLMELAVDYARTFIGHGMKSHSAAYPYESVYKSEKHLLMQDARDEVLNAYHAQGLVVNDDWKDCEDHMGLELEFMRFCAQHTAEELRSDNEDAVMGLFAAQRDFMTEHLSSWAPDLSRDIRRYAKSDLYRGLADLNEGFLAADQSFLDGFIFNED